MFAKVFEQILDSSIAEDYLVRLVFEDFLLLAGPDGIVDMTHEAIARRTNVPIDIVRSAIHKLSQPDPRSRSPKAEGRRLVLLDSHRDWGWQIVNYKDYRNIRDEEGRRAYMREYMRNRRNQVGETEKPCGINTALTPVNTCKQQLAQEEEEEEKILVGDFTPEDDLPVTQLVKDGWNYWLDRTGRHASQNKLTKDRLSMGRKGFESLISFAKEREAPEPIDAAVKLFRIAVDRMAGSPFHSGQNEQGTSYNAWQHLFAGKGYPSPRKLLEFWLDDKRWEKCS